MIFFNLIRYFFIVIISFNIIQFNIQILYALNMDDYQKGTIVEELRLKVPFEYKEIWLEAEEEVWKPWLKNQDGFLGRQVFYNKNKGEALLLVNWKNKELWKNISLEEVNRIQNIYENKVMNILKLEKNPFELIYEGELYHQG